MSAPRSSLPIPLLLLAALALVGCREPASTDDGQPAATAPQGGLPDRDSALAHRLVEQQGALLLDVRTKEEFDAGHIEGARHLPFDEVPARMDEIRGWVDGNTDQ
ncbi:MAG: rhodanese-like domain-containing protein, partial [Nannocystaceae bacterium]